MHGLAKQREGKGLKKDGRGGGGTLAKKIGEGEKGLQKFRGESGKRLKKNREGGKGLAKKHRGRGKELEGVCKKK